MEVKKWTYEEFPEYQDERFRSIDTDGNDIGVVYLNDVEYVKGLMNKVMAGETITQEPIPSELY